MQQIADQCMIAMRQARLYQTVQTKAEGLETLIRLKDEFLTSITHELRTPISSISLAIQTSRKVLEIKGAIALGNPTVTRTIEVESSRDRTAFTLTFDQSRSHILNQ